MSADKILKTLKEKKYRFVDLRFCDTLGKEQHVSLPVKAADEDLFEEGKMFDGSSIAGWSDPLTTSQFRTVSDGDATNSSKCRAFSLNLFSLS